MMTAQPLRLEQLTYYLRKAEGFDRRLSRERAWSEDDTYLPGIEQPGYFLGGGIGAMGLSAGQVVTADALRRVMQARHPADGSPLTKYVRADNRPGFDVTFKAPKSAAILHGLTTDPYVRVAVEAAHVAQVKAGIEHLERVVGVRRGTNGVEYVPTRGLVVAAFTHFSSQRGDPLLHTHGLVANIGQGVDADRWSRIDTGAITRHVKQAGYVAAGVFRNYLTAALGVEWSDVVNGLAEFKHISEEQREVFSKRAIEIRDELQQMANDGRAITARTRAAASIATRNKTLPEYDGDDVRNRWREEAEEVGLTQASLERLTPGPKTLRAAIGSRATHVVEVIENEADDLVRPDSFRRSDLAAVAAATKAGVSSAEVAWAAADRAIQTLEPVAADSDHRRKGWDGERGRWTHQRKQAQRDRLVRLASEVLEPHEFATASDLVDDVYWYLPRRMVVVEVDRDKPKKTRRNGDGPAPERPRDDVLAEFADALGPGRARRLGSTGRWAPNAGDVGIVEAGHFPSRYIELLTIAKQKNARLVMLADTRSLAAPGSIAAQLMESGLLASSRVPPRERTPDWTSLETDGADLGIGAHVAVARERGEPTWAERRIAKNRRARVRSGQESQSVAVGDAEVADRHSKLDSALEAVLSSKDTVLSVDGLGTARLVNSRARRLLRERGELTDERWVGVRVKMLVGVGDTLIVKYPTKAIPVDRHERDAENSRRGALISETLAVGKEQRWAGAEKAGGLDALPKPDRRAAAKATKSSVKWPAGSVDLAIGTKYKVTGFDEDGTVILDDTLRVAPGNIRRLAHGYAFNKWWLVHNQPDWQDYADNHDLPQLKVREFHVPDDLDEEDSYRDLEQPEIDAAVRDLKFWRTERRREFLAEDADKFALANLARAQARLARAEAALPRAKARHARALEYETSDFVIMKAALKVSDAKSERAAAKRSLKKASNLDQVADDFRRRQQRKLRSERKRVLREANRAAVGARILELDRDKRARVKALRATPVKGLVEPREPGAERDGGAEPS